MTARRTIEPSETKAKRKTTTIEVTESAMEKINAFVARRGGRGMKKHALSRLVEWFGNSPDAIKSYTTGMTEEGQERTYAAAFRRLADEIEEGRERDAAKLPSMLQSGGRETRL